MKLWVTAHLYRPSIVKICIVTLSLCTCANPDRRSEAIYQRVERLRRAGDAQGALRQLETDWAGLHGNMRELSQWKFRVLKAELLLSVGDFAGALELLAQDPPGTLKDARIRARMLADRAYAIDKSNQKERVDTASIFDQAYDLAHRAGGDEIISHVLIFRAIHRLDHSQLDLAEADLRAAIDAAVRAHDSFRAASARATLGMLYIPYRRYDEALQWLLLALETTRHEGYDGLTALILTNTGWCYFRLGDYDNATKDVTEGEARLAKAGKLNEQQKALGNLGNLLYVRRDYAAALSTYQKALSISENLGAKESAFWLTNLATTFLEIGNLESAERLNRRVLDMGGVTKDPVIGITPWINGAQIAVARRKFSEARDFYDRALAADEKDPAKLWTLHAGLADLYWATGDPRVGAEFKNAVDVIDASWSALVNDSSKLTFPASAIRFYHRYVEFLMHQRRETDALNFVEAHHARLLSEKTGAQSETDLSNLSRQRKSVLLSYWLAPEQSYLWVVAPGKPPESFKLPSGGKICPAVEQYTKSIREQTEATSTGRDLYNMLVDPARKLLPHDSHVVVVPDGCLSGLNPETLLLPDGKYWIEDVTLEIAPSLRLLGQSATPKTPPDKDSILLIGNPTPDPSLALPRLLFAPEEIASIAALYPKNKTLIAGQATPEAYRLASPSRYSLIHFAAHALANRDSPLDSSIVLSHGKLYAREVEHVPLSDALVTISACQSAGAKTYTGEGLVGFAWAFLGAGARGVIASLWDVNDRSTAEFMRNLYTRLRQNESPEVALRSVKLESIRSKIHSQPYFWAPFQIYSR